MARKLTKLERQGKELLWAEGEAYLKDRARYDLRPNKWCGPGWQTAHRGAWSPDHTISGLFCLTEYPVGDGERYLALSLSFERPSRDWSMTIILNGVEEMGQVRQINISKEYKGMGNGQYLMAERINGRWAITQSEYD